MKKITQFLAIAALVLGSIACDQKPDEAAKPPEPVVSATETSSTEATTTEVTTSETTATAASGTSDTAGTAATTEAPAKATTSNP